MENLKEAIEKNKLLAAEKSKIVDQIIVSKSKQEILDLQKKFAELSDQQALIYLEINRLSNGTVYINKKGTKIMIRSTKKSHD